MSPVHFVKGDEPQRPIRHGPPVRDGGIHNHEVAVDDRRHGASAMRRERGPFLTDRSLQSNLPSLLSATTVAPTLSA